MQPNSLKSPTKHRFLLFLFALLSIALTAYLLNYWLAKPRATFDQIQLATPTPNQQQPCSMTTGSSLQRCCQEWADQHNLLTIQCLGEWYLESGNCAYRCSTSNTLESVQVER